jgi:hypothetical protein
MQANSAGDMLKTRFLPHPAVYLADQPRIRYPANPQKGKTKVRHLQLTHPAVSFHTEQQRQSPDASSPGQPLINAGFTPSRLARYKYGKCTAPLTAPLSRTGLSGAIGQSCIYNS